MKTLGMIMSLCAVVWAAALTACADIRAAAPLASRESAASGPLTVTRGDFTGRMLLTGELEAEDAVVLVVPNANIWPLQIRWVAEDGVEVAEGEVVADFDNTQLLTNLDEMRIQALEAANRLDSEKARLASEATAAEFEVAKKHAELAKARLEAAVPAELMAEREYEKKRLDLKRAELELGGAERKLTITRESGRTDVELQRIALFKVESAVAKAEASIDKLSLRAPRDGILIVGENRREGRPIRPGDSLWPGQVVARLPDLATLAVAARLFDVDDERVRPGQAVTARLDAFPESEYTGRVREVDEMAAQSGSLSTRRFFGVKVTLDEVDVERMRPGMSVKLVIEGPPLAGVLLVPRAAIDWLGDEPRAIRADGVPVPLTLGPCNAFQCVARAGLEEGVKLRNRAGVMR